MIDTAPMDDLKYEIIARSWHERHTNKWKITSTWHSGYEIKKIYTFKEEIDKILELEGSENNV
jgi:hypothetical protein